MSHPVSPYLAPGFYEDALAKGRHRDIVGGRWDETGRIQMQILRDAGLQPHHRLLDIGAGSLRLGCKAVPFLDPGHYWATDASLALMLRGRALELPDPDRLPLDQLIEDFSFDLTGVPPTIDFAIAFGVFTHLPFPALTLALPKIRSRLTHLKTLLFTVFCAPDDQSSGAYRQKDGVVTHPDRPPYHFRLSEVESACRSQFSTVQAMTTLLPRGQILIAAKPTPCLAANQP